MRATVFGIGYVGLVQAAVLADAGHEVLCVDTDEEKVEGLRQGHIPIHEPGLDELVCSGMREGRLHFTTSAAEGVAFAPVLMIATGTPLGPDASADIGSVRAVAAAIGESMEADRVVAVKSTVPVGTGDEVEAQIEACLAARGLVGLRAHVVSNPEFLKEGAAIADCAKPDRIIVGSTEPAAIEALRELYAPFNRNHEKFMVMDRRSSELTKYAANCMLAARISLMNEIANLSERVGADVEMVRRGIGSDPRIGYDFIYPGLGYGGSCFPKDVRALIRTAHDAGLDPIMLEAVHARNEAQKGVLLRTIADHFDGRLAGRRFALWGLSYKPNTDDMRDAPSRVLMEGLWAAGAIVQAYDPAAMEECQRLYGERADLILCGTKETALRNADALVIATEWKGFRAPSFETLRNALHEGVVFDGRNLYEPEAMAANGLDYFSVGRPVGYGRASIAGAGPLAMLAAE